MVESPAKYISAVLTAAIINLMYNCVVREFRVTLITRRRPDKLRAVRNPYNYLLALPTHT